MKNIYDVQCYSKGKYYAQVVVQYYDDKSFMRTQSYSFQMRVIARSRLVRFLNMFPFVDIMGVFINNTAYLLDGMDATWKHDQSLVQLFAAQMAHRWLNYSSWWSFYMDVIKQTIKRHSFFSTDAYRIGERHAFICLGRERKISESTC